jgi:hypothetical protein
VTIIWFSVWLTANNVGGHEPLLCNPVNAWAATLILAIALDLSTAHARGAKGSRYRDSLASRRPIPPASSLRSVRASVADQIC